MTRPSEGVVSPMVVVDAAMLAALAHRGHFAVLYLGSSFSEFTALPQILPQDWTVLPVGERLNAAAKAMREAVIDLDAAVVKPAAPRDWWDATHLGERNPLASTFILDLAHLAVLREALDHHDRCLILSDDRALCRLFHAEVERLGHHAGWIVPGRSLPLGERLGSIGWRLRCIARGLRVRLRGFIEFGRRRSVLRMLRRQHPLQSVALREADVLFVSWARAESFPSGAALPDDPYLPQLAEAMVASGNRVAYLMRALPSVQNYRTMAQAALACPTPVLLLEELVTFGEMAIGAVASLLLPFRIPRVTLSGEDITAPLRLAAWRELGSWDVVPAFGHRGACRRLATLGIAAGALVHPFEHQPWEKLLHAGMRRWLSRTRIVGVQHSPFAYGYLSLFPSRREIADGLIPDRLLVPGEGYAIWFRQAGFPGERTAVIGAPRYERSRQTARTGGDAILCCTGIDLGESIELAVKAALASRDIGHPVIVNYHPVTDGSFRQCLREAVDRIAGDDLSHVRYVDAPARTLLDESRVVLYSTSAAAFDALLAGKPAIYVGREVDLDLDKMPDDLAIRRTSVSDLRAALLAVFASPQSSRAGNGSALSLWLAPFNPETVRCLLAERMLPGCAA